MLAFFFKFSHFFCQIILYLIDCLQLAFFGGHKEIGGINLVFIKRSETYAGNRVHFFNTVNLIIPKHHAEQVVAVCQINIYRISFDTEIATIQFQIIADIQAVYQTA